MIWADWKRRYMPVQLATALALVVPPPAANAQEDARSQSDAVIEEILVIGSRIKRRDFTSPDSLSTLDRETLSFAIQPTIEESLNRIPQVTPEFDRTSKNPGDGTAHVNLRGLASERTRVLLNGRRLAPSGVSSSVDINNIPQALVDRVEIITGGAATVYGFDAVAGVVNFVTRDDFDGFGIDATPAITRHNTATPTSPTSICLMGITSATAAAVSR